MDINKVETDTNHDNKTQHKKLDKDTRDFLDLLKNQRVGKKKQNQDYVMMPGVDREDCEIIVEDLRLQDQ